MTALRVSPQKKNLRRSSSASMASPSHNHRNRGGTFFSLTTLFNVLGLCAVWASGFFMAKNIGYETSFRLDGFSRTVPEDTSSMTSKATSLSSSLRRSGYRDKLNNAHRVALRNTTAAPAYQPGVPMNVQQRKTSRHPKWKLWTEMTPTQRQAALQETNQYLNKYGKLITSRKGPTSKQTIQHGTCELTNVGLEGNHQLCGPVLNGNCTYVVDRKIQLFAATFRSFFIIRRSTFP